MKFVFILKTHTHIYIYFYIDLTKTKNQQPIFVNKNMQVKRLSLCTPFLKGETVQTESHPFSKVGLFILNCTLSQRSCHRRYALAAWARSL